jgi:hypothetical protein
LLPSEFVAVLSRPVLAIALIKGGQSCGRLANLTLE